jgi:hypothetical protein
MTTNAGLLLAGVAAGALGGALGVYLYNASRTHHAATTPPPPTTSSITLAAGAQSASMASGSTLNLVLPTGASWATGSTSTSTSTTTTAVPIQGLASTVTQPTGSQSFALTLSPAGTYTLTCNWTDSTGAAQTTTLTVTAT